MEATERGRRLVLVAAAIMILVSAGTILTYNMALGQQQLISQVIRFILTVVLVIYLFKGYAWARWVSVVLLSLASLGGIVAGISLIPSKPAARLLVAMGVLYLVCLGVLAFSGDVAEYFRQKTELRTGANVVTRTGPGR